MQFIADKVKEKSEKKAGESRKGESQGFARFPSFRTPGEMYTRVHTQHTHIYMYVYIYIHTRFVHT